MSKWTGVLNVNLWLIFIPNRISDITAAQRFAEIPPINLASPDNPVTEALLLSQLRHALIDVGFMYIEGHGMPQETINAMREALHTLFSLPSEAKSESALSGSPHFLGYSA